MALHTLVLKRVRYGLNRLNQRQGKLPRPGLAEEVVDTFAQHGFFIWGGDWNYPIDYQHFQVGPRSFVETLAAMDPNKAGILLDKYRSKYQRCRKTSQSKQKPLQARAECVDAIITEMR